MSVRYSRYCSCDWESADSLRILLDSRVFILSDVEICLLTLVCS